eukprot:s338_g10.t1
MLRVWSTSGQEFPVHTEKLQDVAGLKLRLRAEYGFPLCLQQLLHGTLCLENTSELHTFAELQLVLLAISAAGSCEAVQELVAYAAMKERGSMTALNSASWAGDVDMLRFLLAAGCNKDRRDGSGMTALSRACSRGHVEITGLLVESGAKLDFGLDLRSKSGMTALGYATSEGHSAVVRLLLQAGASVDLRDCCGRTLLGYAASEGHLEIVHLLLDKNARDCLDGMTALSHASSKGHRQNVRALSTATRYCIVVLGTNAAATGRRDIATEFVWVTDVYPPKDLVYADPPLFLVKESSFPPPTLCHWQDSQDLALGEAGAVGARLDMQFQGNATMENDRTYQITFKARLSQLASAGDELLQLTLFASDARALCFWSSAFGAWTGLPELPRARAALDPTRPVPRDLPVVDAPWLTGRPIYLTGFSNPLLGEAPNGLPFPEGFPAPGDTDPEVGVFPSFAVLTGSATLMVGMQSEMLFNPFGTYTISALDSFAGIQRRDGTYLEG